MWKVKWKHFQVQKVYIKNKVIFFSKPINFEVFFDQINGQLELATIERFSNEYCRPEMAIINGFSNKTFSWQNDNFSLIDTKNFNGCSLFEFLVFIPPNAYLFNTLFVKTLLKELSINLNYVPLTVDMEEKDSKIWIIRWNRIHLS